MPDILKEIVIISLQVAKFKDTSEKKMWQTSQFDQSFSLSGMHTANAMSRQAPNETGWSPLGSRSGHP